jgi:hypothetical protein
VFALRGAGTASHLKDEQITVMPSVLAALVVERAWGITVPRSRAPRQFPRPMSRRPRTVITLRLWPTSSDEQTRFRLDGMLPTDLPPFALHQLLSLLVFWSGRRIHAVLPAVAPVGWSELWCDALASAPEQHLSLEFEIAEDADDAGR